MFPSEESPFADVFMSGLHHRITAYQKIPAARCGLRVLKVPKSTQIATRIRRRLEMKGYFVNDWTRGYRCDYGLSKIGRPWSGETLSRLLAEAERIDQLAVGVEVRALEVVKELAAARNHAKQAAAAVVILGVHLEVLGKVVDAGREKSDLDFRRAGIAFGALELSNDLRLGQFRHGYSCQR